MDFFSVHNEYPILVLLGFALFPRITMLIVAMPVGILHWLGWLFVPHLTVAIVATTLYWDTNPVLCVISWLFALGGTSAESSGVKIKVKRKG